jgi:hypothetical protein
MRQAIYNRSVALLIILFTLSFSVAAQTVREGLTSPITRHWQFFALVEYNR